MITRETLLPVCQRTWQLVSADIPPEHASRWQVSRTIGRHGTRSSILYWSIWDARCNSHGIDHRYLNWLINYDPEHFYNRDSDWQLQLYINTIRLYRNGEKLRAILPRLVRAACPPGLEYYFDDHSVQLVNNFELPGSLDTLPELVTPLLVKGLVSTASLFDEVFSLIAQPDAPKTKANMRDSLRRASDPAVTVLSGSLSRAISARLRDQVVSQYGRICHLCRQPIPFEEEIHIDHVVPWAAGGLTVLENLRPAHGLCNLRKGGKGPFHSPAPGEPSRHRPSQRL